MATHRWKFYRAGGVDQVALRDFDDVGALADLDPKLWVALSMPTRGVELDPRTVDHIDSDKDGRIRIPEILAAVEFVKSTLADPNEIVRGGDSLALAALKDKTAQAAGRRILDALGKKDASAVTLADIDEHAKIVVGLKVNGDGVLPPEAADDDATRQVIVDVLDTVGGVVDKGGAKGVNQALVDQFFTEAQAYVDWHAKGDTGPLGDKSAAAVAAVQAMRAKVDDYFTRCRLAAFDPRAAGALNGAESDYAALAPKDLSTATPEIAKLPLARAEAGRPLPLKDGINPAWSGAVATLVSAALQPLGRTGVQLTEADWVAAQGKLAAYEAWAAAKPTNVVEKLGIERLRAILAGPAKAALADLIATDAAQDSLNAEAMLVERALLYKRDLFEILNNYVNFSRFYARKGAVFQAGTLFIDGRSCDLCIEVTDPAKHASLAGMAATYLAYCDITRPNGEKKTIAAALTGGAADNVFVGRNGVFIDRKRRDWDATVARIVTNPISIREAFWTPYKKLARFLDEQVAKRASAAEAKATDQMAQTATAVATADTAKPADAGKHAEAARKIDVGTVAAIGVAVGGIGAMVVGILNSFFGLGMWMPVALLGLILLISAPAMVLAYMKLRQRNLGPILDANGWAVNGRARINVPFGGALTDLAALPKGAEHSLQDPYAEKHAPVKLYVVLLVVLGLGLGWYFGKLDGCLPSVARSTEVLGSAAPGAKPPAPPASAPAEGAKK
jgi:hypothetical protein